MTHSPLPGNQYTTIHTPPIVPKEQKVVRTPPAVPTQPTPVVLATPTVVRPTVVTPPVVTPPVVVTPTVVDNTSPMMMEDDEFDLSKDMDEILDSDGEDSDSEDQFEEIVAPTSLPVTPSMPLTPSIHPASPSIPLNLALPSTPKATLIHTSSPTLHHHAPSPTNVKKRKLASAPIRHPGMISPVIPLSKPTPNPMLENKRQKTESSSEEDDDEDDDDSSSGSESGSTDDSSSGESESESGSSSDDDEFESLAQDISMSLDKGGLSAPASPQHRMMGGTPGHTPTPSTRQPSSQGAPAPMSLRALFSKFVILIKYSCL